MQIGVHIMMDANHGSGEVQQFHPLPFTQALARLDAVAGYAWNDATTAQLCPMGARSIGLAGMQFGRTLAWAASKTCY